MTDRLLSLTPYVLVLFTLLYSVADVVKDWGNYKKSTLKFGVLAILLVIAVLTVVSLRQDARDKVKQNQNMSKLSGEVQAATDAQTNNTRLYLKSFRDLSSQLADLKTEAATDELQKKLLKVQSELETTQKALAPGPKAELTFSFDPPLNVNGEIAPVTESNIATDVEGNVHISFDILNLTNTDAINGEVVIAICDACKFAKEPERSSKATNAPDTQRIFQFDRILAKTKVGESLDIVVPSPNDVQIGMSYRCTTCIVPGFIRAVVHQLRNSIRVPVPTKKLSLASPLKP